MPPTSDGGLRLMGYRLSVSFDDGVTWANNLDLDIDAVSGSGANPPGPSAAISHDLLAHDALGAHESASSYGAPAGQLGEPGPAIFPGLASAPAPAAATADLPPHATTDVLTGAPHATTD